MNNNNTQQENPYIYVQQSPVGVAPRQMQDHNLLRTHAHSNLHAIPAYNMNYMQAYNQYVLPYAYLQPQPIRPMHLYPLPIYNLPAYDQRQQQLYNQGPPNMYGMMPPNNPYGPAYIPPEMAQKSTEAHPQSNFIQNPQQMDPHTFNAENNVENLKKSNEKETKSKAAVKNHIFLNGVLYNTEFLGPGNETFNEYPVLEDSDNDYDPSEDTPSIYGLRFYNPFYGPEGAIPKKANVPKVMPCSKIRNPSEPYSKPPEASANGLPHFKGYYSLLPLHRLANADSYGSQAQAVAREILRKNQLLKEQQEQKQEMQDELDKETAGIISPNSKSKQRRQGRNRSRGFTQSFGIVAPVKRGNLMPNENVAAAKNVLSLFDKKHSYKKWSLGDINMDSECNDDVSLEWPQSRYDCNNNDTFNREI